MDRSLFGTLCQLRRLRKELSCHLDETARIYKANGLIIRICSEVYDSKHFMNNHNALFLGEEGAYLH